MALDSRRHLVEPIELSAEDTEPPLTPAEQAWLAQFRASLEAEAEIPPPAPDGRRSWLLFAFSCVVVLSLCLTLN